jgi:hypothetical protein
MCTRCLTAFYVTIMLRLVFAPCVVLDMFVENVLKELQNSTRGATDRGRIGVEEVCSVH